MAKPQTGEPKAPEEQAETTVIEAPVGEETGVEELDAEFEAALAAALALDPSERIDRYSQLADQIKEDLA